MQSHKMQQAHRAAVVPSLVAALASAFSAGAWAQEEPSPYYIGITQALTHDSNVYGSPNAISDNYSSTGLRGGFDQTISRQRLYGNANVRYNKYQSETGLDNTSYGVAAGWDWATINQLSGTIAATANQSLASLDTTTGSQNTSGEKNLVKSDQLSASVMWGGAGALSLQGAYSHSRVSYSAASYAALDSSADSASLGLFYRLGPDIKLGTALRYVRTETPNGYTPTTGPSEPNTANIRNLDLTADWRVTAQSGVDARLSWTRQTNSNDNLSDLDFSGLTGMLSARYAPTGKTSLSVSLSRDVGTNASFYNNPSTGTTTGQTSGSYLTHNSQTTDTLSLGANYLATAKITVNTVASYRRSKIAYDNGGAPVDGNDDIKSIALGAEYAIARSWQLGCKLAHSSRNVSGSSNFSYTDNSLGCSAQLTIR